MKTAADLDLWVALGGDPVPAAWVHPRGRLLVSVVTDCGSKVAAVYQEPAFPLIVVNGYRLTRAHTNMVIFDQALLDSEAIMASSTDHDVEGLDVVMRLVRAIGDDKRELPLLRIPESRGDLSVLARQVDEQRHQAEKANHRPSGFRGLSTSCPKCRRVHYLADDLVAWWVGSRPRPAKIVSRIYARFSKADGWTFPAAEISARLETYRDLLVLLQSS